MRELWVRSSLLSSQWSTAWKSVIALATSLSVEGLETWAYFPSLNIFDPSVTCCPRSTEVQEGIRPGQYTIASRKSSSLLGRSLPIMRAAIELAPSLSVGGLETWLRCRSLDAFAYLCLVGLKSQIYEGLQAGQYTIVSVND
jgi:hypothetical protein